MSAGRDGVTPRVGCDVQAVAEVAQALADHGQRYLDRVFTPAEQAWCGGRAERLATRFAAKEAVLKALGSADGVELTEVEIKTGTSGRPELALHGVAREFAEDLRIGPVDVSTSHSGGFAFAVAVAVRSL